MCLKEFFQTKGEMQVEEAPRPGSLKVEILLWSARQSSIESQVLGLMGGLFGTIRHKNF